jgi:ABC-2 type transport system permease protein
MRDQWRVFRHTVVVAFAELQAVYSLRSWALGWLLRLLFQVGFFTSIGYFVESDAVVEFLVVGNAVLLVALDATVVIMSSVNERQSGTLPLLVASPAGYVTVFLGRGVHWIATGMASASITLFLLAPAFGVPIRPAAALPIVGVLLAIGVAAYCYGAAIGALVLQFIESRWIALNVSYMTLMVVAGVNVPVDFWPRPVALVAQVLPVTHGLEAVRLVLAAAPASAVLARAGLELAVAAAWLTLAAVGYTYLGERGRADGSIEFSL